MVDSGGSCCLCHTHFELYNIEQQLHANSNYGATSRGASSQYGFAAGIKGDSGGHGGQRPLARLNRIGNAADQAVAIGRARLGREIIHFII